MMEMYKARFEQEGYKVLIALNGTPVMDMIKKCTPELVLLDIVMPEKDGYEVLKELKSNKLTKDIPILIFSNLAQDAEIKKGLKSGADDYFVKSDYTPTQLVSRVGEMIKKSRSKKTSAKKKK